MTPASLARDNARMAALLMFQSDVEAAVNTRNAEYDDIGRQSAQRYANADARASQQIDNALGRLKRSQETLSGDDTTDEDDDE